MRTILRLVTGLLIAGAVARADAQPGAGYRVIVNAANPVEAVPREKLSQLFLKKVTLWADGARVQPVDLAATSSLRADFSRTIHGRDVRTIQTYWQQMVFAGRAVPPAERASDADVVEYVSKNRNAIGYVSEGITLPPSVRVLRISE